MVTITADAPSRIIRWHYLYYAGLALVVMVAAIASHDRWFLNFVHVMCGVMWTGIDLFMGFIVGPILRRIPLARSAADYLPNLARPKGGCSS